MVIPYLAERLGNGSKKRAAGKMRRKIVAHELPHGFPRFHSAAGMVRLKNDIIERHKPRINVRLIPEDIEGRAGNSTPFEGVKKRRLIHNRSPRNIDEKPIRAKSLKHRSIEDLLR